MLDDDGTLEGDFDMPGAYWRLADATGQDINVRVSGAHIATLPRLAFGHEFQRLSDIHGQRYLGLWDLTRHDAYRLEPAVKRQAFEHLAATFPDTFTTVVGRQGPTDVWLALPLAALTDENADAIIAAQRAQHVAPPADNPSSTGERVDA